MRRPSTAVRLAAVAAATALVLTACGGDEEGDGGDGASGEETTASGQETTNKQLYFVDGNAADYSDDFDPGTLEGVKATYPGAELGSDFKKRLDTVDPKLDSYTYGPESYDATVVTALAAVAAKSDDSKAIAQEMIPVSGEGTKCTEFKECAALLDKGEDIDYEGVSGPLNFNPTGSPSAATIGIFQYGPDNTIKPTDYVEGEVVGGAEPTAGQQIEGSPGKGDGELVVGSLLPQTGDLAFLEPPETAGVQLAIQDINKAGGVLGKDVSLTQADSGDNTPVVAPNEVDKLLAADADVVVGAASSDVSLSVLDQITNAGVLQISPANTSTAFDTYDDKGLYFRTAPSDVLQGRVMADQLAADGFTNVAIMARQDAYGEALAENVEKFFTEQGGEVVANVLYSPESPNYSSEVDEIAAADPDAIVLIGFDEPIKIIPEMISAGIGPN
ncbi:MAG: ABC transporter substrate-binding protein, partial [Nocardioidaceae bacterium]